ncbi:hypothetical protein DICPUDRAFT_55232 [Dictyostelium purpureum]|uniref:Ras GTPase n=1 Tax=Dictyostelium purpureum TaxID=5786 RepID=F0ZL00_DICPU|nr:uncharacterized protein DICPUDRAFT_55232 [Dictyostelium purpureum]EGC35372.1 hypothetical protein DICPUDRAFT_55232 [Dictyostelium purpureum]|eukprot:XP_003288110.1 hypothetical protein DICPUDRAFT_55232 [Dictyostelium purpureum]
MKRMQICVLGLGKTGKSSLIRSFVEGVFDQEYVPTIEGGVCKSFSFRNEMIRLSINDTAGSKEFNHLVPDTIKQSNAFIIVYSLDDRESFDSIQYYKDLINQYKTISMPAIILVANKTDLPEELHQISKFEREQISKYYQAPYVESSSTNSQSLYNIFIALLEENETKNKIRIIKKKEYERRIKILNQNGIIFKMLHKMKILNTTNEILKI